MKNFLVIGLGEFGKSVAKTLYRNKATVLVIDARENLIKQALNEGIIEEAIILDATDEIALKKVVRDDFDTAFVSVGDNIQASILITLQLKELGVKNIICKAVNHTQEKVLYKIGATQVVFPEESMGEKVAYSVMELNLRHKYEINILAVKHSDGKMNVTPDPNIKLNKDDLLIILSRENVIDRVTKT